MTPSTQSDKELLALLDILPLDFINNAGHWDDKEATEVVGEYMTKLKAHIAEETNTARIETLEWFKKKGSKSNHCDNFELQVQEADVDFEIAKLSTLKANKGKS